MHELFCSNALKKQKHMFLFVKLIILFKTTVSILYKGNKEANKKTSTFTATLHGKISPRGTI